MTPEAIEEVCAGCGRTGAEWCQGLNEALCANCYFGAVERNGDGPMLAEVEEANVAMVIDAFDAEEVSVHPVRPDAGEERPEVERPADPDPPPAPEQTGPAEVLAAARIDLVQVIREGIPEREFIPGGEPLLIRGKRYLFPSPAGEGKSLGLLVVAVGVVEAGGTAAILDVENGSDEYARRLADVLDAKGDDGSLGDACSERLRYFVWPALRVDWNAEEWAAALAGVDLTVFDSSRLMLSAAGLAEDSNDDYAAFVNALLIPLARAGMTTAMLDNMGHDGDRARGASSKRDLNEVVYKIKVGEEFDRENHGHLRLIRDRTRFPELPAELHLPIGGGVYGPLEEAEPRADSGDFRPTTLMERLSEAVEMEPGLSVTKAREAVKGKSEWKDRALFLLIAEGYVRVEEAGQARRHYSERLYRATEDPKVSEEDE